MYDAILSGVIGDNVPCNLDLFSAYTELLISGGTLIVKTENNNEEKLFKSMKMCGFLNVTANKISGIVVGNTPTYKVDYKLFYLQSWNILIHVLSLIDRFK